MEETVGRPPKDDDDDDNNNKNCSNFFIFVWVLFRRLTAAYRISLSDSVLSSSAGSPPSTLNEASRKDRVRLQQRPP